MRSEKKWNERVWGEYNDTELKHLVQLKQHGSWGHKWLTLVILKDLTLPVCRTCGPLQRSISGPHRYTVVVGVFTFSLSMRTLNWLYWKHAQKIRAIIFFFSPKIKSIFYSYNSQCHHCKSALFAWWGKY